MSRIGKKPISIPSGVEIKVEDGLVKVKGPKGELTRKIRPELEIQVKEGQIFVSPKTNVDFKKEKRLSAFWGLTRALIANMVEGVTKGYDKKLEMVGIGYRAAVEGEDLVLQVGFVNPIKIKAKPGVKFGVEKNIITVSGIDKELVGQVAAAIRKVRPPEPYKGKGIRYVGEEVRKKMGKKAATTATT